GVPAAQIRGSAAPAQDGHGRLHGPQEWPRLLRVQHVAMAYENVLYERELPAAVITINRPRVLNAINHQTIAEIGQALDEADADSEVRGVIITGAGERAFVSGADIGEL